MSFYRNRRRLKSVWNKIRKEFFWVQFLLSRVSRTGGSYRAFQLVASSRRPDKASQERRPPGLISAKRLRTIDLHSANWTIAGPFHDRPFATRPQSWLPQDALPKGLPKVACQQVQKQLNTTSDRYLCQADQRT